MLEITRLGLNLQCNIHHLTFKVKMVQPDHLFNPKTRQLLQTMAQNIFQYLVRLVSQICNLICVHFLFVAYKSFSQVPELFVYVNRKPACACTGYYFWLTTL